MLGPAEPAGVKEPAQAQARGSPCWCLWASPEEALQFLPACGRRGLEAVGPRRPQVPCGLYLVGASA